MEGTKHEPVVWGSLNWLDEAVFGGREHECGFGHVESEASFRLPKEMTK